jgi:hypothetical protein
MLWKYVLVTQPELELEPKIVSSGNSRIQSVALIMSYLLGNVLIIN